VPYSNFQVLSTAATGTASGVGGKPLEDKVVQGCPGRDILVVVEDHDAGDLQKIIEALEIPNRESGNSQEIFRDEEEEGFSLPGGSPFGRLSG
jgi:hypothetical protein